MGTVGVGVGSGAPGGRGTPRWVPLCRISDNTRISECRQRGFGGVRDRVERHALASGLVSTTSPSTRPDPCVADLDGCRWRASRDGDSLRLHGCRCRYRSVRYGRHASPSSLRRHPPSCRLQVATSERLAWLACAVSGSRCVVRRPASRLASVVVRVALALAVAVVRRLVRWSWRGLRRLSWSAARLVPSARLLSG